MYTPTKEELEELGFSEDTLDYYPMFKLKGDEYLLYNTDSKEFRYSIGLFLAPIYPKSLEDIKTLIRILTPQ